jgi:hypothetical protein
MQHTTTRRFGYEHWIALFLLFGIGIRIFRYSLGMAIWGDEGFLGVNILDRNFRQLLAPMEYIQVAPLGYLWAQRAMYLMFGMSEYVMRLLSTLAGIGGLILFTVWAANTVEPLAATIAVGVLAVSDIAVRNAAQLKPYGIDLLAGVLLLYLATGFLQDRRTRWLWWLAVATPVALFFSLPAVFVAVGVALALLLEFPKMSGAQKSAWMIFVCALAATFGILFWGYIGPQLATTGPMQEVCWVFPPRGFHPWQFAIWFFKAHSGNFFGYPLDLSSPGCAPSFALAVLGLIVLARLGRGRLALLLASPFVMTFLAALLRKYPYGDSQRVGQHLVGPICLLIGVGAATVIRAIAPSEKAMRVLSICVFVGLLIIGLIGPVVVALKPSRETIRDRTVRNFIRQTMKDVSPVATIAVVEDTRHADILSRWYIHEGSRRIIWGVGTSELAKIKSRPLLVVSSPIDLTGVERRVERGVGESPAWFAKLPVPGQVGYLFAYFP